MDAQVAAKVTAGKKYMPEKHHRINRMVEVLIVHCVPREQTLRKY
jgi:hypothetical protein